jgi:hypothetical protein
MRCEFINHYESAGAIYKVETFTLRYQGHIPSGGKTGKAEDKHRIRTAFSVQLGKKWTQTRLWNQYMEMNPPFAQHRPGQFCSPDYMLPFFRVSKCGLTIYPLVTAHNGLWCELEIWLSVFEPRLLSPTGDIDNKIKIVFDALRMPQVDQEIPDSMRGPGSDTLYCLLEDDTLIRKFSVEAEEAISSPLIEELAVKVKVSTTNSSHRALTGL